MTATAPRSRSKSAPKVPAKRTAKARPTPTPAIAETPATPEAALRAAIVANPDDDGPRLVFADWLSERGDPRGELVVAQCTHAKTPNDALKTRIEALLENNEKAFAGELAPYLTGESFERGCVTSVAMTIAAFAKHGDRLLALEPVRHLTIKNARWSAADLQKLAAAPALGKLRSLRIHAPPQGDNRDPLAPFSAAKPDLASLRALSIDFCGHSPADWKAFFGKLDAPALETVKFFYNHSGVTIFESIAQNPRLAKLRRFEEYNLTWVGKRPSTKAVDKAIAGLAQVASLEELILEQHYELSDAAVAPFFEAATPATLQTLELVGAEITDAMADAIAKSPKAKALRRLQMHNSKLTPAGIRRLLAETPNLEHVGLTTHEWTPEQHAAYHRVLLELPQSHALREVELWLNRDDAPAELRARYSIG